MYLQYNSIPNLPLMYCRKVQCSAVQWDYSIEDHNIFLITCIQVSLPECSATKCDAVCYSAVQRIAVQWNAM